MQRAKQVFRSSAWIWALILASCAGKGALPPPQALPVKWYQLNETVTQNVDSNPEALSPQADRHVQSVLDVHAAALEGTQNPISQLISEPGASGEGSYWDFDLFIAGFAVSTNGILGSLLSSGTTAVRGIWTKVDPPETREEQSPSAEQKSGIPIPAGVSRQQLSTRLEPSIRAALASGLIQDEKLFRKNVQQSGLSFKNVCESLLLPGFDSEWHLDQYRLDLSFNAAGKMAAGVGVGGAVSLRLECQREGTPPYLRNQNREPAQKQPNLLAREIANELQFAAAELYEMESTGYFLQRVRIGVGVSASGDLVIARGGGSAMGSMTFFRDRKKTMKPTVIPTSNEEWLDVSTGSGPVRIFRENFRSGLARAMKMGNYFAEKAQKVPSKNWKLSNIETEFDLSIGGNLSVATVSGNGVVVLGFARNEE